jgi:hypothetical protein
VNGVKPDTAAKFRDAYPRGFRLPSGTTQYSQNVFSDIKLAGSSTTPPPIDPLERALAGLKSALNNAEFERLVQLTDNLDQWESRYQRTRSASDNAEAEQAERALKTYTDYLGRHYGASFRTPWNSLLEELQ